MFRCKEKSSKYDNEGIVNDEDDKFLRIGTLIVRGRVKENGVSIECVYKIGGDKILEKGGK